MSKKEFIENTIYYAIIIGIVYLCGKYLLPVMIPFIVGFAIAYVAHEISKSSTENLNQGAKIVVLIGIYIVFALVVLFAGSYLFEKIKDFITWVSGYAPYVEPIANEIYNQLYELAMKLPSQVRTVITSSMSSIFDTLKNVLLSISSYLVTMVTNMISGLPAMFVSIIVAIVSSFYILLDYEKTFNGMKKLLPSKISGLIEDLVMYTKNKLFKIIGSYAAIMGITFAELLIGFVVFKISPAGLLALGIAVLDILPVLGVGTVLLPWFVVALILGDVVQAIEIIALYLVITVIRNIVEPKLVGADLGLDPLPTLMAMIVGMDLFGVLGLFGLPLGISFMLYRKKLHSETTEVTVE